MAEKREAVFFSCDDGCEYLEHEDPDEAIAAALDDWDVKLFRAADAVITVYGFARMYPTAESCGAPLESLLETLDEDRGNPDGPDDATDAMKKAEAVFIAAVLAEYVPWACEAVGESTVNVAEWVKKNNPEWLEDDDGR